MLSLREALGKVEQAPTQPTVRQLAGWLDASPASLRDLLQRAAQFERIVIADLSFLAQNMALMVFPGKYGGVDRNAAVASLIAHLGAGQFDVVGLSECFANDERGRIKSELGAVYPFSMEGPLEGDVDSDGGLLLLSRHPIIQRDTSIFRMCYDVDCLADKGILHARIQVPDHPTPYDIYLTHLQDPDADSIGGALNYGPGSNAYDKIRYQLDHVASFVQACGSPECPAILMGDLNVDALNQPRYDDMRTRLGEPSDLWTISGKGSPGFTWDAVKSFGPDSPPLPPEDPSREQSGQRVDYFWSWRDGHLWLPNSAGTEVVIWEASPGRQISDHYGLTTCQTSVCLRKVDTRPSISGVYLKLDRFHCLRETSGSIPVVSGMTDGDEVQFRLAYSTASGADDEIGCSATVEDVDSGEGLSLSDPLVLHAPGDPGEHLDIKVTGYEVDVAWGVETGRVTLGPGTRRLQRAALLWLTRNGAIHVASPVLCGDDGEYVAKVEVTL